MLQPEVEQARHPLVQGTPLPGRPERLPVPQRHFVNGRALQPPWPEGMRRMFFALGCFWGAEKLFWAEPGVYSTAVGYMGGATPNPSYQEVCSGRTGHTEAVMVVYDPQQVSEQRLLQIFWQSHNPTQGMRQGNDIGTQYRSAVYCADERQLSLSEASCKAYQQALTENGLGRITTDIALGDEFYYAEEYHQQYLARNPGGYCGLSGTGIRCPQ